MIDKKNEYKCECGTILDVIENKSEGVKVLRHFDATWIDYCPACKRTLLYKNIVPRWQNNILMYEGGQRAAKLIETPEGTWETECHSHLTLEHVHEYADFDDAKTAGENWVFKGVY